MPVAPMPPELLADLTRRGFAVRAVGGGVAVTPASALTPGDRAKIREHRAGLIALLSVGEPWDGVTAIRLMDAADGLVARLGVDGWHPAVEAAAAMVVSAHMTKDMKTVRFAVAEFETTVRRLAGVRVSRMPSPADTDDEG